MGASFRALMADGRRRAHTPPFVSPRSPQGVAKPGRNTRGQLGTNTDFAPRGHRDKPAGPAKPTFDEAKVGA